MSNSFKARLVNTTNENVKKYIGEVRTCTIHGNLLFMIREDGHMIRTSEIKKMKKWEYKYEIETNNSIYELEFV